MSENQNNNFPLRRTIAVEDLTSIEEDPEIILPDIDIPEIGTSLTYLPANFESLLNERIPLLRPTRLNNRRRQRTRPPYRIRHRHSLNINTEGLEQFRTIDAPPYILLPELVSNEFRTIIDNNKEILYECCICYNMNLGLYNINEDLLSLDEIKIDSEDYITDYCFYGPCKEHIYCGNCIRNIAINYDNHPVNDNYALIRCLYPFANDNVNCKNLNEPNFFFKHRDICKCLTFSESMDYKDYIYKYKYPGYKITYCKTIRCGMEILIDKKTLKEAKDGDILCYCQECNLYFCYHCNREIPDWAQDERSGECYIDNCKYCENNNAVDPERYNHYVYNTDITDKNRFIKNKELTTEIIIRQLVDIVSREKTYIRCFKCLTYLYRGEDCNGLECCNTEICYSCGKSALLNEKLVFHWQNYGIKGCPRYDIHEYWNNIAYCGYKCIQGICYSLEMGECKIDDHQNGIKNMNVEIKQAYIYNLIKSLLPELQDEVMNELILLWDDEEKQKYIPSIVVLNKIRQNPELFHHYSENVIWNILDEKETTLVIDISSESENESGSETESEDSEDLGDYDINSYNVSDSDTDSDN